jgi:hypothetical protein
MCHDSKVKQLSWARFDAMRDEFVEFKGHVDPVIREVLDENKQSENKMLPVLGYK